MTKAKRLWYIGAMKGLTHIYHGYGKGKTTAATGLAVRCIGYGEKVIFSQFLKGSDSGEIDVLKKLGATVMRNTKNYGFFPFASKEDQRLMTEENNGILRRSISLAREGKTRLLVLDEVLDAYNIGALDKTLLDEFVADKPEELELVLTGRDPSDFLRQKADYITHFDKEKHPYDKGVTARKGIEY